MKSVKLAQKASIFSSYIIIMSKKELTSGKRKRLTMDELVVNAKKILKDKQLQHNNRNMFEKVLKRAVTTKQHGSKGVQT